ncbi:hypothetical protein [Celeribacter sp. ULVN23_4]
MIFALNGHWRRYRAQDDGAVTVDWVVLVSAIVGLSLMVIAIIWEGAYDFTLRLNSEVESIDVADYLTEED